MKSKAADGLLTLGIVAFAILQFGWIFSPTLGNLLALANAGFLLALCGAYLASRLARRR